MSKKVCVVIGVGPGNGQAYATRFSKAGYAVALLSRDLGSLKTIAEPLDDAHCFACDASDPDSVTRALGEVGTQLGSVDTLIYNAGAGDFGPIDTVSLDAFESAWRINTLGLAAAAQAVIPAMREAGSGNIIISGATASKKGGANFAAFAQAKAAQRSLAQSMARQLGADGIHVALIIIDAVVDLPRTRKAMPDRPKHSFAQPAAIADGRGSWWVSISRRGRSS